MNIKYGVNRVNEWVSFNISAKITVNISAMNMKLGL